MREGLEQRELPGVPWGELAPYLSVVVVEATADDPVHSFGAVLRELKKSPVTRGRKRTKIVASGEASSGSGEGIDGLGTLSNAGVDQVAGFVREIRSVPSWLSDRSEYTNTTYDLNLVVRRGRFLAVKPDDGAADRFQRWIDKSPRLVQRVSPVVLECTFLMGRAKGLWLQSATGRNMRQPDAKTSVGMDLRETLSVFADSSYSLGSARCELPEDADLLLLKGAIGATIRSSQLWLKPMQDISEFIGAVCEVFDVIESVAADEDKLVEAFPQLAREVTDLSEVFGAYDVAAIDIDHMPPFEVGGDDTQEAAEVLRNATIDVISGSATARFKLDVGLGGVVGGRIAVSPKRTTHGFELDFGFSGEPSRLDIVRPVLDALSATDLLTVYYESGHVYSRGRISKKNATIFPFDNWRFQSFDGFDVKLEKPFGRESSFEIHQSIGQDGDVSLFGWVLENYSDGWLVCDDGSGESADFLQIDSMGTLRIIHVKGADSKSVKRRVSAAAYEVVASQASKNLVFMDKERMVAHLQKTDAPFKASWIDGKKTVGRVEFVDMLRARKETDAREVVIVQPHLREAMHVQLRATDPAEKPSQDLLRLQRLETLLNSTRSSIVNSNAELWVVGSNDV